MAFSRAVMGALAAASVASATSFSSFDFSRFFPELIAVDVAVVGGGGSGAHAALRMSDAGKSLVVLEAQSNLGGHVSTYIDPQSGKPYDFGVNSYTNYTGTVEFTQRLGVPMAPPARLSLTNSLFDFTTGQPVNRTSPPNASASMKKFYDIVSKYDGIILPSYANFPTSSQAIPADLLMKFGDFVAKYQLEDAVPMIYSVTGAGLGDLMDTVTMFVLATFGAPLASSLTGGNVGLNPVTRRNQDIYDSIANVLTGKVRYNTTVVTSLRTAIGVTLVAKNNVSGKYYLVLAKKLLMAIQPTPANMEPFNLDSQEQDAFSKAKWSNVQVGIVSHPSLPINGSVQNVPAAAAPNHYTTFATSPYVLRFDYMGDTNFRIMMVGPDNWSTEDAQALAQKTLKTLMAAGALPSNDQPLTIRDWSNHGSLSARASADDVRNGFITKQKALQGRSSTYWTGAYFSTQLSTTLWAYNDEYLLPMLYKNLWN